MYTYSRGYASWHNISEALRTSTGYFLLWLCCAVAMFSLSLVGTVEVGTVEVGMVEVGTVQVGTVSDVSDIQWAVDEFSLSQVYFSLIWVWVLGAERGQIPVESSWSWWFVLV